jgi:hypothetical protein
LSTYLRREIKRIRADIARIDGSFFNSKNNNPEQMLFELRMKRGQLLRSIILELHLSIENILSAAIGQKLLAGRLIASPAGHALRDLLEDERSIGFHQKLTLARALDLVTTSQFKDLLELNSVRNRCSHNWLLDRVTRRKIKRAKPKKPLLRYRGTNLYKTDAFLEFASHFTKIYLKLWLRHG